VLPAVLFQHGVAALCGDDLTELDGDDQGVELEQLPLTAFAVAG
jgi:hypothetical protein